MVTQRKKKIILYTVITIIENKGKSIIVGIVSICGIKGCIIYFKNMCIYGSS